MYCPKCAAPIDETQKFCRACGANVSLVSEALEGKLPGAVMIGIHHGRRRNRKRDRHDEKKVLSIEEAMSSLFTGIGFFLAAVIILRYFPGGIRWGWTFFIPAFACIGRGVGQYLRLKHQYLKEEANRQQYVPVNQMSNYLPAIEPATPAASISAPTTSELQTPSSVTEHTTKHLNQPSAN